MQAVSWFYVIVWLPVWSTVINFCVYSSNGLFILLVIFVALIIIGSFFKTGIINKIVGWILAFLVILILITCYLRYSSVLDKFIADLPDSTVTTDTTKDSSSSTGTTPTKSTTTTSPKHLYYGGGCYSCYADACPRDGYSYGGWDVNMFNYYRSLCQACQCNSSRWQSLWR